MRNKRSQYLALLLRHQPELANLEIKDNGWVDVATLIRNTDFTLKELKDIVSNDEKGRYSFDTTFTRIRANQGHSVVVKMDFEEYIPEGYLYHGTAIRNADKIYKEGIKRQSRQYVHLSKDEETARKVGKRHGKEFVLVIDAVKMYEDGIKFFISSNGVVLTNEVEPKYLMRGRYGISHSD